MSEFPEDWENERKAVHEALGEAALGWNYLESAIAQVYSTALGAPSADNPYYRSIIATFYAIVSFEAKLKATDAALTYTLYGHAAEEAEWRVLRARIDRCRKTRNNLAHYTLVGIGDGKPGRRVWLQLPPLNPAGLLSLIGDRKSPPRYFLSDLRRIADNFAILRFAIDRFCFSVVKIAP